MSVRIITGHVIDVLRGLPAESVHMVCTSPPYYGLRCYGIPPQTWPDGWVGDLGLEPTLDLYLDHMLDVCRQIRRVLRKDGTFWLNIGSSYAANGGTYRHNNGNKDSRARHDDRAPARARPIQFKPKNDMLVPHRLAIRLQEDRWYVRKDIILAKRAPMPESCNDRPTSSHEHLLLLTKSPRYFWDRVAVMEEFETDEKENYPKRAKITGRAQQGFALARGSDRDKSGGFPPNGNGRNMRDVWWISPEPLREQHFAAFPSEIPRRAILAATSAKGVCPICAAPWARVTKKTFTPQTDVSLERGLRTEGQADQTSQWIGFPRGTTTSETLGWRQTCSCDPAGGASAHDRAGCSGPSAAVTLAPIPATMPAAEEFRRLAAPSQRVRADLPDPSGAPATAGQEINSKRPRSDQSLGGTPEMSARPEPIPATVLDPFLGSGTTAIVADQLARNCIGIELSPAYAQMARRRLTQDAGLFADIAAE